MLKKPARYFDRDQLVMVVELIFVSAWDRIDAVLPALASNPDDLKDYRKFEEERLEMIQGHKDVVSAALPILYATLTDDGMGIGDFPQFETFETQVQNYIFRKCNPSINRMGANLVHPDARALAEEFVDDCLGAYQHRNAGLG